MKNSNSHPGYNELKKLTDGELLKWIRKKCRQAFDVFIMRNRREEWIKDRLYFLMHFPTGEKEVYQRFLIRLWKSLEHGLYRELENGDFKHWMGVVIQNMVNEFLRRPKHFIDINEETERFLLPVIQDTNIQKYEWANDLEKLEYGMREDYRDEFNMHVIGQLTIKEIAEITHKSLGRVKSDIHRGKEYLQRQLGRYYLNTRTRKHKPVKLGIEQKKAVRKFRSVNDDEDSHLWRLHAGHWMMG